MNLIPTAYAQATDATQQTASAGLIDFAALAGKIVLAIGLVIGIAVFAMIAKKAVQRAIQKKQGDQHKEMVILYGRMTFTVIMIAGSLVALIITGMPLEWFTGALGLGLAFAVRAPVANFIAGIALLTQNSFNIGDFIKIGGGISGTITDITGRSTSLRALDGAEITVPNIDLLTKDVTCYTKNPVRRREIPVGVGYGTNLKTACELIRVVAQKHKGVEPVPAPVAIVDEIGESTVNLKVRFWVSTDSNWLQTQSDITREIFDTLMDAGVDIPYPTRTMQPAPSGEAVTQGNQHMQSTLEKLEAELDAQTKTNLPPVVPGQPAVAAPATESADMQPVPAEPTTPPVQTNTLPPVVTTEATAPTATNTTDTQAAAQTAPTAPTA